MFGPWKPRCGNGSWSWLHAIVHRMEGDLGNAGYWYARCGRRLREDVPAEAELRELEQALRVSGS